MVMDEQTTLFVDYNHVIAHEPVLAEGIQMEFYRYEPYLRKAVEDFVRGNENVRARSPPAARPPWLLIICRSNAPRGGAVSLSLSRSH